METVSRRDYFAAHANIDWIKTSTSDKASLKTGIAVPVGTPVTDAQWEKFWEDVEVAWRWKYANNMLIGKGA